jgi:hypothetical protein
MAFRKLGEAVEFDPAKDILTAQQALGDEGIARQFVKMAKKLKRLAPKANDFTYFHAIIMHSAEASLIDQKTGEPIKNANGQPVCGGFEEFTNKKGQKSLRWVSSDGIKPYRNANRDIFGEAALLEAHKKWAGRPLCKDHQSDSIDGIRGIIIDTYYDPKFKRVHALAALDKKNYADLAHKVESGYANSVSMGTAVGRSICSECGNIAVTEKDYCNCVKTRAHYGEINLDLNPIELSLVVTPADSLAKVRQVIASMNQYVQTKQAHIEKLKADRCVNPTELQALADSVREIQTKLSGLMGPVVKEAGVVGEYTAALKELTKQLDATTDDTERLKLQNAIKNATDAVIAGINTETREPEAVRSTLGGGEGYAKQNNEAAQLPSWAPEATVPQRFASREEGDRDATELGLLRSKVEAMVKSIDELKVIGPAPRSAKEVIAGLIKIADRLDTFDKEDLANRVDSFIRHLYDLSSGGIG